MHHPLSFAPFLTIAAYVFDLSLMFVRGEFPYWGDSMGIPMAGAMNLFVVLLVWSGLHLAFVGKTYQPVILSQIAFRKANWWLLLISVLTVILLLWFALVGQYW